ncbi:MAG: hypothetical protein AAFR52_10825 [Pseudomonadota bacterium]
MSMTIDGPATPAGSGAAGAEAAAVIRRRFASWMVMGAALYVAMGGFALLFTPDRFYGSQILDYQFLALVEGRLDVPARLIGGEGHLQPDGRAFAYNGFAPLVTRALAWPFVDLRTVSMAMPTIVLFAFIGSAFVLRAVAERLAALPVDPGRARGTVDLMGLIVFLLSPGLVLTANGALYSEPLAVAYAGLGILVWALARVVAGARPPLWVVPLVGAVGAVLVHARPGAAPGIYLAALAFMALALLPGAAHGGWRGGWRVWGPVMGTLAVMGLSGLALLGVNTLRSGSPFIVGGTPWFSELTYGMTWWGFWEPLPPEERVVGQPSRFGLHRLVPNILHYAVDLPAPHGERLFGWIWSLRPADDPVVIGRPMVGAAWIWLPWLVLGVVGTLAALRGAVTGWPGLAAWGVRLAAAVALGLPALMILSYGTVEMRYTAEWWPALAFVALGALPWLVRGRRPALRATLVLSLPAALFLALLMTRAYSTQTFVLGDWTAESCQWLAERKGMAPDDAAALCAAPEDHEGRIDIRAAIEQKGWQIPFKPRARD